MTNVHGISVSGGSFPAEIWRRFMDPALAGLPARDFPEPAQPVVFQHVAARAVALSYDPYYVAPPRPRRRRDRGRPRRRRLPPKDASAREAGHAAKAPAAGVRRRELVRRPGAAAERRPSRRAVSSERRRSPRASPRPASSGSRPRSRGATARRSSRATAASPTRGRPGSSSSCSSPRSRATSPGSLLLRRGVRSRSAPRSSSRRRCSSSRSASPLLLSTDAWTYWGYGWIAAEGGGNPYVDPPSDFPESPAAPYLGADWRDTTSVYGPAFTLVSEPVARVAGSSADAAAWLFKSLAAARRARGDRRASRGARGGPRSRPRSSAGTPCWRSTRAGGGHNDALVGALVATAVALGVHRRATCERRGVGARGARQVGAARLLRARRARRARPARVRTGARGVRRDRSSSAGALATWRYGLDWLGALGPLADNAVRRTSYALPSRLEQLGVPARRRPRRSRSPLLAVGLAWLARDALARRRAARARRLPRARDDPLPRRLVPRVGGAARGAGGRRPASLASPRSRSRRTCCRRRSRSEPEHDDPVLRRTPARKRPLARSAAYATRERAPVRPPGRGSSGARRSTATHVALPEHREAEDAASFGQVRSERVRRAHRRVRRDQPRTPARRHRRGAPTTCSRVARSEPNGT